MVKVEGRRELTNARMRAVPVGQLSFFKSRPTRRGKHRGGRPPKGPRSSERHEVREQVKPTEPVHVVLRVARSVGRPRRRGMYQAIRWAPIATPERHEECRIIHASIQGNHLHLIVEAMD